MSRAGLTELTRRHFDRERLFVLFVLVSAPWFAFPPDFIPRALLDRGDDLVLNLPQLVYSGKKLFEGEIFWTPELWMGHPLLADPEFATFYFPKLLLLLGSSVVSYAAYLVLHYLAAEFGAYLYLKSLGIGRCGALFGALAYAYAGFMLGHRAHTMYVCAGAWSPFVLLMVDRATEHGGRFRYLGAALGFAMLPLCGAVQLSVYLTGMLLLLSGARAVFERSRRPLMGALLCLVPGLLVSALQIVPSIDFSSQLATGVRRDYELDVMHSFHPLLLPTLAIPEPPLDAELYSRAGTVVLCAAFVTLARIRSVPERIRAWAVVALVALLLMLGRHLPPLARLLHELPVVGVIRGPARHNFELGLALSVLGAYGVHAAKRAGAGAIGRWILGGVLFSGLAYAAVRSAAAGLVDDPAATKLLIGVTGTAALGAGIAFMVWVAGLSWRGRPRAYLLWALVAVTPVFETAWAMRIESRPNQSALGLVETARAALPDASTAVRLLSVSQHRGSADVLGGNSVLFHPGVGSLQGYSSIAYTAARQVLDLDMHGQPVHYDELALSILPSVFGATHVVLPSLACGDLRASLVRPDELCARGRLLDGMPALPPVDSRSLGCTVLATDATWRYELRSSTRAAVIDAAGASLSFLGSPDWTRRFGLDVPGPSIGPDVAHQVQALRLADSQSWGGFLLMNDRRSTPVDFLSAGLYVERDTTKAALTAPEATGLVLERTETFEAGFRLRPDGALARVERRIRLPRSSSLRGGRAVLEVEARTQSKGFGNLVVDLYAPPDYDEDQARISVQSSELGPAFRAFSAVVAIDRAPEEFSLRAIASGTGTIELREARLSERKDELVYALPVSTNRYPQGARVRDGQITLDPLSKLGGTMHLPVRAFEVLLDAEAPAPLEGPVLFGFGMTTLFDLPRTWEVGAHAFDRRARVRHVAVVPPDIRDPILFVRADGAKSLRIHELSATDACGVRGYRNPRRLANGLFLYENPRAVPRAYTVGNTVQVKDLDAVRSALLDFDPSDLGRSAVVTTAIPPDLQPGRVERAEFGARSNDVVVTSENGPTLLVTNERFDPDWRATLDGAPVDVFPVNGLVRGVLVPRGTHRVHFEYRIPRSVWLGIGLAACGVLAALFAGPALGRMVR